MTLVSSMPSSLLSLDALAVLAGAPSFAFVEFLFLLVEGFFDGPTQATALVERSR